MDDNPASKGFVQENRNEHLTERINTGRVRREPRYPSLRLLPMLRKTGSRHKVWRVGAPSQRRDGSRQDVIPDLPVHPLSFASRTPPHHPQEQLSPNVESEALG
ncbi:hypothetical protein QC763_0007350 [Podospora pseudopauciseta]|uniref:Uncharacterized protein n=1 Tax=Podospora pseudopauciseta TaxID=2093780 RepID=A0ABR0HXI1_9PEZI|nr:hypothetical protein QC763_0007350 [Podospora pseudopauciseta]